MSIFTKDIKGKENRAAIINDLCAICFKHSSDADVVVEKGYMSVKIVGIEKIWTWNKEVLEQLSLETLLQTKALVRLFVRHQKPPRCKNPKSMRGGNSPIIYSDVKSFM